VASLDWAHWSWCSSQNQVKGACDCSDYKPSAAVAREVRAAGGKIQTNDPSITKGKEDFDGTIDGAGYKRSFDDTTKYPLDLIPPTAQDQEARVWMHGAVKYARGQWLKGMSFSGILAAAQRHTLAMVRGEDIDPESGLPHAAHVRACMAMLLEFQQGKRKDEYAQFDDRVFKLNG
jgi:hypothetical protein